MTKKEIRDRMRQIRREIPSPTALMLMSSVFVEYYESLAREYKNLEDKLKEIKHD